MTSLAIDSRHPPAVSAVAAMRSGDLERTGIFARRPELAVRVVRRVALDMSNRIVARGMGMEVGR